MFNRFDFLTLHFWIDFKVVFEDLQATGPGEFHEFLAKELDVEPSCIALKGYGSGIPNCAWHSQALAATEEANVVIWDGATWRRFQAEETSKLNPWFNDF